ncbi:MAG: hypothetical protein WCN98_12130 [Verrucomicrobiaceae bacterium]
MNQRIHLHFLAALLLVPLAALNSADAQVKPAKKPNIIVFLADDMPWNYPGFNGGPCETPKESLI